MNSEVKDNIWRKNFDTAEEFLTALSPWAKSTMMFQSDAQTWLFRGQANEYELLPSAWRPGMTFCRGKILTILKPNNEGKVTLGSLLSAELGCVKAFFYHADRGGSSLPEDGAVLRDELDKISSTLSVCSDDEDIPEWPPLKLRALFGLAQHHGIPTRLLDFSRSPFLAAYFCVESLIRRNIDPRSNGRVTLWVFNNSFFEADKFMPPNQKLLPYYSIHVPTAPNHNLKAQDGLFVCQRLSLHRLADLVEMRPFTQDITTAITQYSEGELSPMYRFSLPRSQTPNLLRLLACVGVTAARLYPGFDGAKRSYDDDAWLSRYS